MRPPPTPRDPPRPLHRAARSSITLGRNITGRSTTVKEADLPGVGKKHEIELNDGSTLLVITHNTGKREVYRRTDPEEDSEKLFTLTDRLARQVGTILEGAYFQPVATESVETMLAGGTMLEWFEVPDGAAIAGTSLADHDLRGEYGVTVVAIQRGEDVIPSPGAGDQILEGDTLVVIGEREDCETFEAALSSTSDAQ